MRGFLLAPLALALALAGCITSSTPTTEPLPQPALGSLALGFAVEGCTEQAALFPVPLSIAAGLPEGFAPVSLDPAGATATIFAAGYSCAGHGPTAIAPATGGEALGEVAEFLGFVMVQPSDAYRVEGVELYGVWFGLITNSPAAAEAYRAWQVPYVGEGEVAVETLEGPVGRLGHILASDANGTEQVYSDVVGQAVAGEAGKARLFSVVDGAVVHIVDVSWKEHTAVETGNNLYHYNSADAMMPPTVAPGIGFHLWGDEYGTTMVPAPLPVDVPASEGTPAWVPLAELPFAGRLLN